MPNKKVTTSPRKKGQNKGRRNNARRASLPPATSLLGHIMRTIVQGIWDIAQGALQTPAPALSSNSMDFNLTAMPAPPTYWSMIEMDEGYLFPGGWLDRYKSLFNEYKIHRIVAHYVPYASFGFPGEYVFALWDCGQNFKPSSFADCIGMPASVIRKSYQPAVLEWFPTEPDDRNWHKFGDGHVWCSSCIYAAENAYKVPNPADSAAASNKFEVADVAGKVTIDVSASFRGKCKKGTPGLDSPSDSAEYKRYSEFISCECRKCRSVVRRHALVVWQKSLLDKRKHQQAHTRSEPIQDWVHVTPASNFG